MKKICVLMLAVLFVFMGCSSSQTPESYPEKQITMIVPWAVGGGTDLTARVFAAELEQELGQKIIISNMSGASGATGTEAVAAAAADGYTILFSADTLATMQVMGVSTLSEADFAPVMLVSHDPKIVTVAGNSPYETMEDLVLAAKENPNKLNLCYSSPGASGHIQALLFKKAGVEFNMTPLGGGTAQILSVISGQSDMTNASGSTVMEYLSSGELRNLALFDKVEVAGYEGVPAITATIPELETYMPATFPVSIWMNKDTDKEILDTLTEACIKVSESESWQNFIEEGKLEDLTHIRGEEATAYMSRLKSIYSWLLFDEGVAVHSPEDFDIPRYTGEE